MYRSSVIVLAVVVVVLAIIFQRTTVPDPIAAFDAGQYPNSFRAFQGLAETGDTDAINYLGIHYYLGLGTDRDFAQAANYFHTAAMAGHRSAQLNLGILYLRGWGLTRNREKAYAWFYQSAKLGDPRAFKYLDVAADYITVNQIASARRWITKTLRDAGR